GLDTYMCTIPLPVSYTHLDVYKRQRYIYVHHTTTYSWWDWDS
ncbi:hypothetical protein AZ012_002474, partial [Citrobacter amalonaticus]